MKPVIARMISSRRRGAVAVFTAATLPVLFGFSALAIDIGMTHLIRTELQRTADAAALAAANDLGGIDPAASMNAALASASTYVQLNPVLNNRAVAFDPATDVVFGQSRLPENGGKPDFFPNVLPANAVRVTVRYELDYSFAQIFGKSSRTISASAAASIGARDFMIVIDCSGSMTRQSVEAEVAADLDALGIPYPPPDPKKPAKPGKGPAVKAALALTYDGGDPEFWGVYATGEKFLPPSVRVQPLKATKDAAAYSVNIVQNAGYDDLLGAVAYATYTEWVEELTTDYARVRAKLLGATKYGGTSLHAGIQSAREELLSDRARLGAEKVIVLMTDGKSDSALALEQAQLAVDADMMIHCVGLGTDVDYDLLNTIAGLGGGLALYVDNNTDPSVYGPQLALVFQSLAEQVGIVLIE